MPRVAPQHSLTVEDAPDAAIEVHGYWQGLAEAFWDGSLSWWDPTTVGGLPMLRGGLPFSQLTYFVTPSWFAPGLAAAVLTVVAILGMGAFLRQEGVSPPAALVGGLAFGFGAPPRDFARTYRCARAGAGSLIVLDRSSVAGARRLAVRHRCRRGDRADALDECTGVGRVGAVRSFCASPGDTTAGAAACAGPTTPTLPVEAIPPRIWPPCSRF